MYKFEVENFKCFKKSSFNIRNLNILAGANGAGKSSLIQALLLFRASLEYNRPFFNEFTTPSELLKNGEIFNVIPLNGPFNLKLGNARELLTFDASETEVKFRLSRSPEGDRFAVGLMLDPINLSTEAKTHSLSSGRKDAANPFLDKNTFFYLSAERQGPRHLYERISDTYHCGYNGEFLGQQLSNETNLSRKIDSTKCFPGSKNSGLENQIQMWLDYIFPGIVLKTDNFKGFNLSSFRLKHRNSKFDFLLPQNIGFGITYCLPIIVNSLIAANNSVHIVENPEAHLHPLAQSRMGEFIAHMSSSGAHIVVETHSDHFINGVRKAFLKQNFEPENCICHFFSLDELNKVTKSEILFNKKMELESWPPGFFDQYENDTIEIMSLK